MQALKPRKSVSENSQAAPDPGAHAVAFLGSAPTQFLSEHLQSLARHAGWTGHPVSQLKHHIDEPLARWVRPGGIYLYLTRF